MPLVLKFIHPLYRIMSVSAVMLFQYIIITVAEYSVVMSYDTYNHRKFKLSLDLES